MGKHKRKSKERRRRSESSDEWEEATTPTAGSIRSNTRTEMRKPLDDEDESQYSTRNNLASKRRQEISKTTWRKQAVEPKDSHVSEFQNDRDYLSGEIAERSSESQVEKSLRKESEELESRAVEIGTQPTTRPPVQPDTDPIDRNQQGDFPLPSTSEVPSSTKTKNNAGETGKSELSGKDEMNRLSAKILKAELRGNDAVAQRLKSQLAELSRMLAEQSEQQQEEVTVVVVTKNKSERKESGRERSGTRANKKRGRCEDSWQTLENKFIRKQVEDQEDKDAMLQRAKARMVIGADRHHDELLEENPSADNSLIGRSRSEFQNKSGSSVETVFASCSFCVESSACLKHLIVHTGAMASVMIPQHESLTSFHCIIVPKEHLPALTQADEETWREMLQLQQMLIDLFKVKELECIFLQTVIEFSRRSHAIMHCIPIPTASASMMPMYFKKAIEECESEWTMNKKLVKLSKGGVRSSIPKGLPYFAVEFGVQNGYAHVIEDRSRFPSYFGLEVIGSVLDVTPSIWLKPQKETFSMQSRRVQEFENVLRERGIDKKVTS